MKNHDEALESANKRTCKIELVRRPNATYWIPRPTIKRTTTRIETPIIDASTLASGKWHGPSLDTVVKAL